MRCRQGASESGVGRWHVRLTTPANVVQFDDFHAAGVDDALAQAQAAHPDCTIEWVVRENDRYGVWSNGLPRE